MIQVCRAARWFTSTVGFVAVCCVLTPSVYAGSSTTPKPTVTAVSSGGTAPALSAHDFIILAFVLFAFALLAIVALLIYLYQTESAFYGVFQRLAPVGTTPQVSNTDAFMGYLAKISTPAGDVSIHGPTGLTVGQLSAPFSAQFDGQDAADATWKVSPEDAATLSASTGAAVTLTPKKAGKLTLSVSVQKHTGSTDIQVAEARDSSDQGLPFIGSGYGSIIIAIILVVAIVFLGLYGTLSGEAVATLFGGLLGYIFGVTTGGGNGSSKSGSGRGKP